MKNEFRILYLGLFILVFFISITGATYAYWVASANSENVIYTDSSKYSISMTITPLYHGFSLIPLNNYNVPKALSNLCHDKYDRGACSAYLVDVYGFVGGYNAISGNISAQTNINNLSYALFSLEDNRDSDDCTIVNINDVNNNYCLVNGYTKFDGTESQILMDSYDVTGKESAHFILVTWLENENRSQNDDGIGTFSASVSIYAGNGGKIQGIIDDVYEIDNL